MSAPRAAAGWLAFARCMAPWMEWGRRIASDQSLVDHSFITARNHTTYDLSLRAGPKHPHACVGMDVGDVVLGFSNAIPTLHDVAGYAAGGNIVQSVGVGWIHPVSVSCWLDSTK
jgi:hypothetical protein